MILTNKGLDLPISGTPSADIDSSTTINTIAILGPDYVGLKPTMLVKEGDTVSSGQKLFEDKKNPGTYITSPSSGVVESINRGEKRRFLSITIDVDDSIEPTKFIAGDYESPVKFLVDTGALSYFKTRPYNRIPSKEDLPNAIFVNACDTNPLAIDPFYLVREDQELFNSGLAYIASINKDAKTFCAFQNNDFDQSVEGINYNQFNG
ncbi:NADH:ubiquinone reductase (Na(+)-transporting) subunit A, partial [Gammaproteobacteria bacterium]|nr:NADH:ubiquinone reductase (Na(+)-transporting) subunit A [Gammaproteobacteria bacterium]